MDQRGKEEFLQEAERRNERQRNETSQADKSRQQQKKNSLNQLSPAGERQRTSQRLAEREGKRAANLVSAERQREWSGNWNGYAQTYILR